MKKRTLFLTFFVVIGIYQSCTYKKTEYVEPKKTVITDSLGNPIDTSGNPIDTSGNPIDTTGNPKPTTISFASDIVPIFNASCKSCHSESNDKLNLETTVYTNVSKTVNITTPTSSKLYTYMNNGHQGATAAQTAKVLTWIKEGAKNN